MATIQKRGISLLLVLVLMLGMIPSVSAAEIETQPSTEPAETTTPVTEETLAVETSPPETTQPEETSPPETTEPEQTVPTEPVPEETELEEETEPAEESPTEETQEETVPDEELTLALMSLDDGVATIADTEIVGAPNAFGNVFLLNGGIDIPSFDHVQHKEHLPLYSVYLKNQPGYENNYYVAYCILQGQCRGVLHQCRRKVRLEQLRRYELCSSCAALLSLGSDILRSGYLHFDCRSGKIPDWQCRWGALLELVRIYRACGMVRLLCKLVCQQMQIH